MFSTGYTVGRAFGILFIKIMSPGAMLVILSVMSFLSLLPLPILAQEHPGKMGSPLGVFGRIIVLILYIENSFQVTIFKL